LKVNLGGIIPLSTVDWMGCASIVLFLRGCPLRCPNCQNRELQEGESLVDRDLIAREMKKALAREAACDQITLEEAFGRAATRPLVSALVLSGGEPLMQLRQSRALLRLARSLGLKTAIETSGFYPHRLHELLKEGIIDKVFLDVKSRFNEEDYAKATGISGAASKALSSLRICMEEGIPLEVRTTIFPSQPSPVEVREIAEVLSLLKKEFAGQRLESLLLQQGLPKDQDFVPVPPEMMQAMAESARELVEVQIRTYPAPKIEKVNSRSGRGPEEESED
jgi:pyruvate formate lyase activating enzyme